MRTLILLAMVAALSSTACKDETGILISVTVADEVSDDIRFLRFYVGEELMEAPNHFADTELLGGAHPVGDPDDLGYVEVAVEDLQTAAHRLMIRPKNSDNTDETIAVGVLGYTDDDNWPRVFAAVPEPIVFEKGKVIKWNIVLQGSSENFRPFDNCFKWRMPAAEDWLYVGTGGDLDCDHQTEEQGDCNDLNPEQNWSEQEDCETEVDDDCNGFTNREEPDWDNDGFVLCPSDDNARPDCGEGVKESHANAMVINQEMAAIHPGAIEKCDGIDNNCSGSCDDGMGLEGDLDGDGITKCGSVVEKNYCGIPEPDVKDCGEGDATVFPAYGEHLAAEEIADGKNNDCLGTCDDLDSLDGDGDGFTEWGLLNVCSATNALADCDDGDGGENRYPGAPEYCDGIDSDCSGGPEVTQVPCFTSGDFGSCTAKLAECSQSGSNEWYTQCPTTGGMEVDLSICTALDACEAADPLVCLYNELPVSTAFCTTYRQDNVPCEGGAIALPQGENPSSCVYKLVGLRGQQGYRVGLVSGNGSTQTESNICETSLKIVSTVQAEVAVIRVASELNDRWQMNKVIVVNEETENCDTVEFHCSAFE